MEVEAELIEFLVEPPNAASTSAENSASDCLGVRCTRSYTRISDDRAKAHWSGVERRTCWFKLS